MVRDHLAWRLRKALLSLISPRRVNAARIAWLRSRGARIGEGCVIQTEYIHSEPYLVDVGDDVRIGPGAHLLTHDAAVFPARGPTPLIFGRISIGSNTFVGVGAIILPGTTIGRDCIVGAGSVVGGVVPDGSVVVGNPARVVMTVKMAERLPSRRRNRLDVAGLSPAERERAVRRHFGLAAPGEGPPRGAPAGDDRRAS